MYKLVIKIKIAPYRDELSRGTTLFACSRQNLLTGVGHKSPIRSQITVRVPATPTDENTSLSVAVRGWIHADRRPLERLSVVALPPWKERFPYYSPSSPLSVYISM